MIARAAASPALRRAAFCAYAVCLAIMTHWPRLAVETPFELRVDVLIHTGVFAGWTVLLVLAGFFGPPLARRNLSASVVTAILYAVLDELTQGIPAVRRTVDPLDLAANAAGVGAAGLVLALVALRRPARAHAP